VKGRGTRLNYSTPPRDRQVLGRLTDSLYWPLESILCCSGYTDFWTPVPLPLPTLSFPRRRSLVSLRHQPAHSLGCPSACPCASRWTMLRFAFIFVEWLGTVITWLSQARACSVHVRTVYIAIHPHSCEIWHSTLYVLCYLIRAYCVSFYGCSTWSLVSHSSLYQLQVQMSKICRRIWHLVHHTHSNYCHLLSGLQAITNLVIVTLISSTLCSNNSIVNMVYSVALKYCRIFVGCNRRYGYRSVRHYSTCISPPVLTRNCWWPWDLW